MPNENAVTLLQLALIFIGAGAISYLYYFLRNGERDNYLKYLEAKKSGIKVADNVVGDAVYFLGRRFYVVLIVIGFSLLGIDYLFN